MIGQFILNIRLGNESMQINEDVAIALSQVAARLLLGKSEGSIFDANGNRVGEWKFEL